KVFTLLPTPYSPLPSYNTDFLKKLDNRIAVRFQSRTPVTQQRHLEDMEFFNQWEKCHSLFAGHNHTQLNFLQTC
ncbi:hypothetical protein PN486_10785, partial [Nodularia spumigena CS-587/03]|nr:hypothetical protein [Nodularia spumigena CS-587/03]